MDEIINLYQNYYGDQSFIKIIRDNPVSTSSVLGTNNCFVQISIDKNTNQITIISAIDNLIKGASGQAIQNMNIMCGWDENLGLEVNV
jgi:N-acetyl-gamma-glutamyl-phosphate reductase